MIRLRTSTLEAFRRVVATDFGSEAALIDTLRRGQWADGPASWQMLAGTAWHAVLSGAPGVTWAREYHGQECFAFAHCGDYSFRENHVRAALEHVGPGVFEATGRRLLLPRVEVEGTADHLRGLLVQDHKAKFSTPDARDYEPSLQWRMYCLIHGAACFRYNLFAFADPKGGYCELRDVVSFRFWPYPGMEAECRSWVRRFLEWAGDRGLLPYLDTDRRKDAA